VLSENTFVGPDDNGEYKAEGKEVYVTGEEYALVQRADFKAAVEVYAADEPRFKTDLAAAWTKVMTADRFSGPMENACSGVDTATTMKANTTVDDR
jgi:catalase (peroxidase I)